jgi:hypothetical protein
MATTLALRLRTAAALALAAAAGCDPLAGISVSRTLQPAPAPQCLSGALAGSSVLVRADTVPVLANQKRPRGIRAFEVTFPDSVGRLSTAALHATETPDSTRLEVETVWLGTIDQVPAPDRALFENAAGRLLAGVTAACAPQSPRPAQCREFGLGGSRVCTLTP